MDEILCPYKMYAEFADGTELYFYGNNEDDCMADISSAREKYGICMYYTSVTDDDYIDGVCRWK